MIEIPEAIVLSDQINQTLTGKRIMNVSAASSPHRFAWYHGNPREYSDLLSEKVIEEARAYGGLIEIKAEDTYMMFGDGVNLRFHGEKEKKPQKHQLLVEFEDFSALSASVQMYGGIWCYKEGEFKNRYFLQAKEKPSPLSDSFDRAYYDNIIFTPEIRNLSAKALLATEQRIPGLGNGVLQDILFNAAVHPKRKMISFTEQDKDTLYNSIKYTLREMVFLGGRDTEKDLFGCYGGYKTKLSKNTAGRPCASCGSMIEKQAYLGGSIYFCPNCQNL